MKFLPSLCVCLALVHGPAARADCPLAFAPPGVRHAASEHYYRSPKRDAPPPGRLQVPARLTGRECTQAPNDAYVQCSRRSGTIKVSSQARSPTRSLSIP